jgi:hypothetical protein
LSAITFDGAASHAPSYDKSKLTHDLRPKA